MGYDMIGYGMVVVSLMWTIWMGEGGGTGGGEDVVVRRSGHRHGLANTYSMFED